MNKVLDDIDSKINILNFLSESAGVKILTEISSNLSKIQYNFEKYDDDVCISFQDFLKNFPFINVNDFSNLKEENVGEDSIIEIYKTYNFLVAKFNKAKEKLAKFGFEKKDLFEQIIKRLVEQVIEAGNGNRILKNSTVVGLSFYSKDKFIFDKIPYFAFACTNVSLDIIKVKSLKDGKIYSLREIDELLLSKNDSGGFFLPNSIGVSVNLMTKDNEFISQERNNQTTLTQIEAKYVASASGAVDYSLFSKEGNLGFLNNSIKAEVEEELGIKAISSGLTEEQISSYISKNIKSILNNELQRVNLLGNILHEEGSQILGRELGMQANLLPVALVIEKKRINPEFIFLGKVGFTLEEIKQFWEKSESKNESLNIKGITFKEIEDEMKNRKNGCNPSIDNHFFMSYIGFLIKSKI